MERRRAVPMGTEAVGGPQIGTQAPSPTSTCLKLPHPGEPSSYLCVQGTFTFVTLTTDLFSVHSK